MMDTLAMSEIESLPGSTKVDLDAVARKLNSPSRLNSRNEMMPKSPSISGASRSRKTSSTVNFMGGAVDDVSVQKTLAMALCSGLRCAKWGEVAFETNQDVLTAILLNVIRKDRGLGFSPLDFNNKEIVLMDLASEKLSMKTFKINVAYQTRESFLKEWKKFKSNSEFVLGKGTQLLYLKSVEGNILSCMTSGAATCPTFTVGNVDAGFYRLQLRGIVGIGDDKGAELPKFAVVDSDGDSADFHGSAMGEYVLEQENPVVYTQRGGGSGRISQIEDAWVVQREGATPALRCEESSELPPQDGWRYNTKLHKKMYKIDTRLTVKLSKEAFFFCQNIKISSTGRAGSVGSVRDFFGLFSKTEQFSSGRPIFVSQEGKVLWVREGRFNWCITDRQEQSSLAMIGSASGSLCPASPRAAQNLREGWSRAAWYFRDSKAVKVEDPSIKVECDCHP